MPMRMTQSTSPQSSRRERVAWRLVKDDHTAEARIKDAGHRRELRINVDAALLWWRVYNGGPPVNLDEEAAAKCRDFEAMGWVVPRVAWRLVRTPHTLEALVWQVGGEQELHIRFNDEVLWSRRYPPALDTNLAADLAMHLREFASRGWVLS